MKITRPSLKRSGFEITPYGCRFGNVSFLIYRKRLYPIVPLADTLWFDLFGVDEITGGVMKKIELLEKKAEDLGKSLIYNGNLILELSTKKK